MVLSTYNSFNFERNDPYGFCDDAQEILGRHDCWTFPDGGINNFHNGVHWSRAAIYGVVVAKLLLKSDPQCFKNNYTLNVDQIFWLIQVGLFLHDSGRLDDGYDVWDKESGLNVYNYLISKEWPKNVASLLAESVANKDYYTKGSSYYKLSNDASKWVESKITPINDPFCKLITGIIQFGDCLDIVRCLKDLSGFNASSIQLLKEYPFLKNNIQTLILEANSLVYTHGRKVSHGYDQVEYWVDDQYKKANNCYHEVVNNLIGDSGHQPLLKQFFLGVNESEVSLPPVKDDCSEVEKAWHRQDVVLRGILNPGAVRKKLVGNRLTQQRTREKESRWGEETLAQVEVRKTNRRLGESSGTNKTNKLEKDGNYSRSVCLGGYGKFFTNAGFLGVNKSLKDYVKFSKADADSGFLKKNIVAEISLEDKEQYLNDLKAHQRTVQTMSEHNEIQITFREFDGVYYTLDSTLCSSHTAKTIDLEKFQYLPVLNAIACQFAYASHHRSGTMLPIYEVSGLHNYIKHKSYTESDVVRMWHETAIRHFESQIPWRAFSTPIESSIEEDPETNHRRLKLRYQAGYVNYPQPLRSQVEEVIEDARRSSYRSAMEALADPRKTDITDMMKTCKDLRTDWATLEEETKTELCEIFKKMGPAQNPVSFEKLTNSEILNYISLIYLVFDKAQFQASVISLFKVIHSNRAFFRDNFQIINVRNYPREIQVYHILFQEGLLLSDSLKQAVTQYNENPAGQLPDIADLYDLIAVLTYFDDTQCKQLLNAIKSKLPDIFAAYGNWSKPLVYLGEAKREIYYQAVIDRMLADMHDGHGLGEALANLNEQQFLDSLSKINNKLPSLIRSGQNLRVALLKLDIKQSETFLQYLDNHTDLLKCRLLVVGCLEEMPKNECGAFFRFAKPLVLEQISVCIHQLKTYAENPDAFDSKVRFIESSYYLKLAFEGLNKHISLLECFSQEELMLASDFLEGKAHEENWTIVKDDLQNNLNSWSDFQKLCGFLNYEQGCRFVESVSHKFPDMINTIVDLNSAIEYLPRSFVIVFKDFFDVIKNKVVEIVTSKDDLAFVLSNDGLLKDDINTELLSCIGTRRLADILSKNRGPNSDTFGRNVFTVYEKMISSDKKKYSFLPGIFYDCSREKKIREMKDLLGMPSAGDAIAKQGFMDVFLKL